MNKYSMTFHRIFIVYSLFSTILIMFPQFMVKYRFINVISIYTQWWKTFINTYQHYFPHKNFILINMMWKTWISTSNPLIISFLNVDNLWIKEIYALSFPRFPQFHLSTNLYPQLFHTIKLWKTHKIPTITCYLEFFLWKTFVPSI